MFARISRGANKQRVYLQIFLGSAHVAGECVAVATADSAVKKPAAPAPVAGVWGLVHVKQPALGHCVRACPPLAVGAGVLHCAMDVEGRDVDGSERIFA